MCKLFAILDIENKENAERYAKKAHPLVTQHDNHGMGIMRLGENGVHIRRWLNVPETMAGGPFIPQLARYQHAFAERPDAEGRPSAGLHALAIHGRFATCEKSLKNTHPFYAEGTALMHNGVITNHAMFTRKLSTCDSEALLWQYIEHEVRDNPKDLEGALTGIHGYYACIVFNDNGVVDIWRDEKASLYMGYVSGVGIVVATTKEIIEEAAKEAKFRLVDCEPILPFTHIRWKKGEEPMVTEFEVPSATVTVYPVVGSPYVSSATPYRPYFRSDKSEEETKSLVTAGSQEKGLIQESALMDIAGRMPGHVDYDPELLARDYPEWVEFERAEREGRDPHDPQYIPFHESRFTKD